MKFFYRSRTTQQSSIGGWRVKSSTNSLQMADYQVLAKPSQYQPVSYFSAVQPGLYDQIVDRLWARALTRCHGMLSSRWLSHIVSMNHSNTLTPVRNMST